MKIRILNFDPKIYLKVIIIAAFFVFSFSNYVLAQESRNAEKYLANGKAAFEKDDYDLAIDDLNKAVAANPRSTEALLYRGKSYFAKNEVDKALADFNKAVELDRNFDAAYVGIGRVYSRKNESDKAVQFYTKAIELNPKNFAAFENRGYEYEKKGQFKTFIDEFVKVAEIVPEFAAYMNRKQLFGGGGNPEQIVVEATAVIENSGSDSKKRFEAYKNRAAAYIGAGSDRNFDKALADTAKVFELVPPDFTSYSIRAEVYASQLFSFYLRIASGMKIDRQKYQTICQNVIADRTKALELAPPVVFIQTELLKSRARCYSDLGEYDKAVADYSKINVLLPSPTFTAFEGRAKAYMLKGNFDKAIADFTAALNLLTSETEKIRRYAAANLYLGRGKAYLQKGEFENALTDFSMAIKEDSGSNVLYRLRAETYLKKGDYEKALADATKSIAESEAVRFGDELGDYGVESYKIRAQIYRKTGKTALAEADEKKALELAAELEKL